MSVVIVTGSAGLIGSTVARRFAKLGLEVVGIDTDQRAEFFGPEASTAPIRKLLERELGRRYRHQEGVDIRNRARLFEVFSMYGRETTLVVHAAAQPSHDWSAREPLTDWDINATGTANVLEATRQFAPDAVVVHMSTNKVYGDRPNWLPFVELETRWEIEPGHAYDDGIDERMPIDRSMHSPFGASKLAADVLAQEYARYWDMSVCVFRGGTLTGPAHTGAELHGFLAYLVAAVATGRPYRIFGYRGKQVRDVIHASDVAAAIEAYWRRPTPNAVYNLGGGRGANVSVLEALQLAAEESGREPITEYVDQERRGDHRWYVSSMNRFAADYPEWSPRYDVASIVDEIYGWKFEGWSE